MIIEELGRLKKSSRERKMERSSVAELEKGWEDEQRAMWAKMKDLMSEDQIRTGEGGVGGKGGN